MRHVFISPHLDDAILSAGNLLLDLVSQKEEVLIVTVFTNFGQGPISHDSRKYILGSGFLTLKAFEKARIEEDKKAMVKLGVKYWHLPFIDAGFRLREKVSRWDNFLSFIGVGKRFYYPFHNRSSLFSGKIFLEEEKDLIKNIEKKVKEIVKKDDILYGPLGIGKHADHLIINMIVSHFKNKKYFWQDQPYTGNAKSRAVSDEIGEKYKFAFSVGENSRKIRLINCYASQVFCGGEDWQKIIREKFYVKK